ncbi:hypothetical protein SERLADRAFT_381153 [Serpula lacrymans var. lacrymans S7.9]|uniref:Uncharacterized protein n=1 Tax=Serpula lacrymans var. lacrymans (strain S7.9) TaxID=578457 RepID=F8NLJ0_SERL9|nr:uncharacterized protein SERLADRAFT_381153 [Serpula lacrymans var. lacrymans S7.9]EGO28914.1 hypothetical protein SERLADRAFT_381153 [Serpula lacrymans var. lacrymans S7.9]
MACYDNTSYTNCNPSHCQTEQAAEMVNLNIKAIAVHSDSVQAAQADGRDLLDEVRRCEWSVSSDPT